jgi:RNA polymerase sigma factor (sigma-70 family)
MEIPTQNTADDVGNAKFTETRWSLVIAAGKQSSPEASAALETLCRNCWYPVYYYVRRKGHTPHDAQDLTQEFFARILRDNLFAQADRNLGRFRAYLLGALNHFLADQRDKNNALKRGGGNIPLSLNDSTFEEKYLNEPSASSTPEEDYDKKWRMLLLENALKKLRQELEKEKIRHFELLKQFLTSEAGPGSYDQVCKELGISQNSAAVSVHRLRQRFQTLIRTEIAETVSNPQEANEEIRHLFGISSP